MGAIQVLRNADGGGGGVLFSGKKRYEGVMFNVIIVTRGWVGSNSQEKSVTQHLNGPMVEKQRFKPNVIYPSPSIYGQCSQKLYNWQTIMSPQHYRRSSPG